eukprot:CAMPEP_0116559162 /NCGR_PEP_ID=MMETSP0397-20121206/10229_1 /TAXON_ID=216820 /ORGANISM="Cyclophora tenuis, Strain ECT3854" /LENGTH=124 /DNA_ID=CAMNT_0004084873 /DNA_START=138 /DNA_END=512 /DNA_ORIENTATION=+
MPTEIGTVSTLTSFSITFCGLVGTIPSEIGLMSNLDRFWIYQNQFTGTIPTEIGAIERMMILQFEGNELSGTMPAEICANRAPSVGFGLINILGADCQGTGSVTSVDCDCCTCCGGFACGDFDA